MKDFSREHEGQLRNQPPRMPIRLADEEDEFGILELVKMLHAEIAFHPLNLPKVSAMISLAIRPGPERRGILGVIGDRHDLKAAIFLMIEPIWYSDDWHLMEFFNYVRPEYRRMGFAADLISYAKGCSDRIGIDLFVGVFNNVRTEAKVRLYRRWLPPMGAFFCYAPPNRMPMHQRLEALAPANKVAAE